MTQYALDDLNACSETDFVAVLANIFEHSPWIARSVAPLRPFSGLGSLFAALTDAVAGASMDTRLALIKAHPDLADKTQRAAGLTDESNAEQNSAGLDRLSNAEYEAFTAANKAYREKFDFPYIVCVRRHTRDSILKDFARRLPHEMPQEIDAAIAEITRIAALRLDALVSGSNPLPVHGRLSTHVLDTASGKPASGVAVELVELSRQGSSRVIAQAVTNHDGRTDAPLIGGRPVPIGRYELRFSIASYFQRQGLPLDDPPFLETVPLQFGVSNPEGHYHVPLLVTPWSFSTYRGS